MSLYTTPVAVFHSEETVSRIRHLYPHASKMARDFLLDMEQQSGEFLIACGAEIPSLKEGICSEPTAECVQLKLIYSDISSRIIYYAIHKTFWDRVRGLNNRRIYRT